MPCRSPELWNAWEGLVDEMKKQNQPVVIARVDCMSAGNLCSKFEAWMKNSNSSKNNCYKVYVTYIIFMIFQAILGDKVSRICGIYSRRKSWSIRW